MSALALVSLSCNKGLEEEPFVPDISGEWKLTSAGLLDGSLVVRSGRYVEITVYAFFSGDGKFKLYQKLGDGDFVRYEGTYLLTGNILTGLYGGKETTPWGNSYEVDFEDDGKVLIMTDNSTETPDRCTYIRTEIPASIKRAEGEQVQK